MEKLGQCVNPKLIIQIIFLFVCSCMTGCLGTIMTRMADGGGIGETEYGNDSFGTPLYAAITEDIVCTGELFEGRNYDKFFDCSDTWGHLSLLGGLWGFCSLPVDVVCDTVLLPIDLIAWTCGYDKRKRKANDIQKPVNEEMNSTETTGRRYR